MLAFSEGRPSMSTIPAPTPDERQDGSAYHHGKGLGREERETDNGEEHLRAGVADSQLVATSDLAEPVHVKAPWKALS